MNIRDILKDMNNTSGQFPTGFYWGTATSAHQIEGGLTNDWSEWEKSSARTASLEAQGLNPADYQSGQADNSWNHFEADIACLEWLNCNAYRFSIEWARIEPEEGIFNEAALEHYHQFIKRLQEKGIEPFVTLWHFSNPLWIQKKGGWTNKETVSCFARYAQKVVSAFPEVKFWLTLNEPQIYAGKSYVEGHWPPQKKNIFLYFKVFRNLIKAHRAAYEVIKEHNSESQVGVVVNNIDFDAAPGIINTILAGTIHWWWNLYFLNQIKNYQDIIGVNFYFHNRVNYGFSKNEYKKVSEMGWELYPASIKPILLHLKRYQKPIYITENGLADSKDQYRAWYIQEVLRYALEAIKEGADLRGYFHWSLLDNFEWAEGFTKKFGLFTVDRTTWERRPRPSAEVYAQIAKNNHL